MTTKEYSSYIKGLLDGTALDTTTPEGKVIAALVSLCDQMAGEIETLRDELDVQNEYLEEMDEDLGCVEDFVYGDDECEEDEEDDEDDECDGDCSACGGCADDEDDDEEEEFYCAMCPNCGGKVYFDDTVNPEDVICPACQKPLISDEDEEEEDK